MYWLMAWLTREPLSGQLGLMLRGVSACVVCVVQHLKAGANQCLRSGSRVGLKVCSEGCVCLGISCVCGTSRVLRPISLWDEAWSRSRSCLEVSYLQGRQVTSGSQWWQVNLEWASALASAGNISKL